MKLGWHGVGKVVEDQRLGEFTADLCSDVGLNTICRLLDMDDSESVDAEALQRRSDKRLRTSATSERVCLFRHALL